jgi:hypothetical protein
MCATSAKGNGDDDPCLGDGVLTHLDVKLQKFAMDPRRAPPRVRLRHRSDQRTDFGGHGRTAERAPTLPRPR